MSIVDALKWSFLSELTAKLVAPLVFIVLVRLLTPEDYGVVAAATMIISFSQIFWEAGMGTAIIQFQGDRRAAANAAFWINHVLAAVVASTLVAFAGALADWVFHDERVAPVLQVMALQVVLSASVSVHIALLQKDMRFRQLFWIRLVTVAMPGLTSIPLAWYGFGYWSLVVGSLVGQLLQVIVLWRMSPWRPQWSFNTLVAKELGAFGAWVGASGLLAWFYIWADSLIVGTQLGSHELGLYTTGNQGATMIFGILFGPILPVLYSHLSRMNQDKERLGRAIESTIRVLTLIAVPLAFIVFLLAKPITTILFGDKWVGIDLVLGVLALTHGIAWTVGMNGEAYRALGKPGYETAAMAFPVPIYVVLYAFAIAEGFDVFVWSRLAAMFIGLAFQLYLVQRLLPLRIKRVCSFMARTTAVMLTSVLLSAYYLAPLLDNPFLQIIVMGAANLAVYCLVIVAPERHALISDIRDIYPRK